MSTWIVVFGIVLVFGTWSNPALAQIRLQETPALNGLGMLLFKDIELRVEGGRGNTSGTISLDPQEREVSNSQLYWGIFIDKPIVSHFLEMMYDCNLTERDWLPRDTLRREFFDAIRAVVAYREGDFHVSTRPRSTEYYVGMRYSVDLGRFARHLPWFQR